MPVGKIKFFDENKGFGYISSSMDIDVYFHISRVNVPRIFKKGDIVKYEAEPGPKGPRATKVWFIKDRMGAGIKSDYDKVFKRIVAKNKKEKEYTFDTGYNKQLNDEKTRLNLELKIRSAEQKKNVYERAREKGKQQIENIYPEVIKVYKIVRNFCVKIGWESDVEKYDAIIEKYVNRYIKLESIRSYEESANTSSEHSIFELSGNVTVLEKKKSKPEVDHGPSYLFKCQDCGKVYYTKEEYSDHKCEPDG